MKKVRKQVIARVVLCLILVVTLVTSTLTAFATTVSEDTPDTGEVDSFFSTLTKVNKKDYLGVSENMLKDNTNSLFVRTGYLYTFVYNNDGVYSIPGEGGSGSSSKVLTSASDISDSDFYVIDNYGYWSSSVVKSFKTSFSVLVKESEKDSIKYIGTFKSIDELPVVKIEYDSTPIVNLSVDKASSSSANIHVSYSLSEDYKKYERTNAVVTNLYLYFDDVLLDSIDVLNDGKKEDEERVFTVDENGKYKVVAETYISTGSSEIEVEGIAGEQPEEVNSDTTKPIITFSKKPKSAYKGNTIEMTMYSDEPAVLNFNGVSSKKEVTEMKIKVSSNGSYVYTALDGSGNKTTGKLKINFFKKSEGFDNSNRDNFWGNALESKLPQTGSIGWYALIVLGEAIMLTGAFLIFRSRKRKASKDSNSEE